MRDFSVALSPPVYLISPFSPYALTKLDHSVSCRNNYYSDPIKKRCVSCAIVETRSSNKSNILIMLVALSMLVVLVLLGLAAKMYSKKVSKFFAGFSRWKDRHRGPVDLVFACTSVVFITLQTVILMASNHEQAGGKQLPKIYSKFLGFFNFVNLDLFELLPGKGNLRVSVHVGEPVT